MIHPQRHTLAYLLAWVALCPVSLYAEGQDGRALARASRSKTLERQARTVEELWAKWAELMREYTEHQVSQRQNP